MVGNRFGKTSVLKWRSAYKYGQTILADSYFTPPFKITKPFYNPLGEMKLIVMSASAGMMAGDSQEMTFEIGEGTNVYYTTQSYEKVHKMEEGEALRNLHITVGKDAFFKYMPLSTIPFSGSRFKNRLSIELENHTSRLFMAEIISAGRVAHQERFEYDYYQSIIQVKEAGKWIYRDNTYYDPKAWQMGRFGLFEGYTHLANILIVNCGNEKEHLEAIRQIIEENPLFNGGASLTEYHAINVKVLGKNSQTLEGLIGKILDEVDNKQERI